VATGSIERKANMVWSGPGENDERVGTMPARSLLYQRGSCRTHVMDKWLLFPRARDRLYTVCATDRPWNPPDRTAVKRTGIGGLFYARTQRRVNESQLMNGGCWPLWIGPGVHSRARCRSMGCQMQDRDAVCRYSYSYGAAPEAKSRSLTLRSCFLRWRRVRPSRRSTSSVSIVTGRCRTEPLDRDAGLGFSPRPHVRVLHSLGSKDRPNAVGPPPCRLTPGKDDRSAILISSRTGIGGITA